MKRKYSKPELVVALSFLAITAFGQKDSSGIYKTAEDFKLGRLSYAINYKTEKHKINDNILFNEYDVKVQHQGITYTLKKSETYGYRDMKGTDFRFVNNKGLKIISRGPGLFLYVYNSAKSIKGSIQYTLVYYFSKDAGSDVQLLTKDNVKAAFPKNHKFHDAIDATFKDDADLSTYDSFHKMYKINHLLSANQ